MPRPTASAALLTTALFLAGCGGDGPAGGSAGATVTDSAGVRVVENSGSGVWAAGGAWTTEEIFRVGGLDAGDDAQFGSIVAVDVDDEGRVYVADQQARQVSVFEPDGTLANRFGEAGQGPGELSPMFMFMLERDGEVWTVDLSAQGIQRFTRSGQFVGTIPFNMMGGIPVRFDETETAVVAQRRSMGMAPGGDVSIGGTGDAITTIGTPEPDTLVVLPPGETARVEGGEARIVLFAPEPVWDIARDGSSVRGMMQTYRLEVFDAEGRLQRIVTRDVAAQPVTDRFRDAILDRFRRQVEAMGQPMEVVEPMLRQIEFADSIPVMAQVFLEPDGHLWVQQATDTESLEEDDGLELNDLGAPRWDVFDPQGIYLGQLELPGRFGPLRIVDGVLWGLERDDLEVLSVVGMRVVR